MKIMTLRPHHLLCLRFRPVEFPDRQGEFAETDRMVKDALKPESQFMIRVAQGVDDLCRACPNCVVDRCEDPRINEEAVRKIDAMILKDLGVSYGDAMVSKEWNDLIVRKVPLDFCLSQCPVKAECKLNPIIGLRS